MINQCEINIMNWILVEEKDGIWEYIPGYNHDIQELFNYLLLNRNITKYSRANISLTENRMTNKIEAAWKC